MKTVLRLLLTMAVFALAACAGSGDDQAATERAPDPETLDAVQAATTAACLRARGFDVTDADVLDPNAHVGADPAASRALYDGETPMGALSAGELLDVAHEIEQGIYRPELSCDDLGQIGRLPISEIEAMVDYEPPEITPEMEAAQAEIERAWAACAERLGFSGLTDNQSALDASYAEIDELRLRTGVDIFAIRDAIKPKPWTEPRELTPTELAYLEAEAEITRRYDELISTCDAEVAPMIAEARARFGLD